MRLPRASGRTPTCACLLLLLLAAGCPHRSPLWSPDGKHILVLAGERGEDVEKAASQLWLVDVASGKPARLAAPEKESRFLAALWLGTEEFLVATGQPSGDEIKEGSEKWWRRNATGSWKRLALPAPSGARLPRRLAVLLGRAAAGSRGTRPGGVLVYPVGGEKVSAVSLDGGKVLLELEPAELVGPGPRGGFLAYRETEGGTAELVAFGAELRELWKVKFSELRRSVAAKLGKKPVEIIFNETSTSHLPLGDARAEWVAVNVVFTDVGWREGIPGYHVRLAAADGKLLDVVHAVGLSGQPASFGQYVSCVTAPQRKKKIPTALKVLDLKTGQDAHSLPLPGIKKEQVHGYSVDPSGRRLALSLNAAATELYIFELPALAAGLEAARKIVLQEK